MNRRTVAALALFVAVPAAGTVAVLAAWGHGWASAEAGGHRRGAGPAAAPPETYRLLVAVTAVLLTAHALGALARRVGQPTVVGQMAAGILLGPSALGALAPEAQHWLLPPSATVPVEAMAQLGVVFFAFRIGYELTPTQLIQHGTASLVLGCAGVFTPLLAGVGLALALPSGYRPNGVGSGPFAVFVGVAFCVTAFPVLAGILRENGMLSSGLGSLAMATAGVADVLAWSLLACGVAVAQGGTPLGALRTAALTALLATVLLTVGRAVLRRLWERRTAGSVMLVHVPLLCSAALTDAIGVHAVFGGFLAGLAMPRLPRIEEIAERTDTMASWLLLPMFFASVGLRTGIGLIGGTADWLLCGLFVALAVAAKLAGTALPARLLGVQPRSAARLGVMMSCRGLTELVVLDTGLQLGLIPPRLFAMLVVMTLATTMLTAPLLNRKGGVPPDGQAGGPLSGPVDYEALASGAPPRGSASSDSIRSRAKTRLSSWNE
ncbi:cation:proton antiporter [Streptomyces rhizosphaericus]|uniref:Sodium:proton exchanger n=1 Tax=Streptomyces rhizosphaericus TaxID=114699 RepID=A0A6G4AFX8_9ACTN|nr:cation:proton antiporter [Streptomyces rhizosphaericus]NEW71407.1 sodium:proton exchanger [Streptomyces rhizosphaericus]